MVIFPNEPPTLWDIKVICLCTRDLFSLVMSRDHVEYVLVYCCYVMTIQNFFCMIYVRNIVLLLMTFFRSSCRAANSAVSNYLSIMDY